MAPSIRQTLVCKEFILLADLLALPCDEIILAPMAYSKVGFLTFEEYGQAKTQILQAGKRVVLLWDRIEKDSPLEKGLERLGQWLPDVAAVRVQDPGVAMGIKEKHPKVPIQLSLEQNSPNQRSIFRWASLIQPERLILSNQFPFTLIEALDKATLPELEIPVLGPLEVFYSPRNLLSEDRSPTSVEAVSAERPRQRNSLYQSDAGTVMFHSRDLYLLDQFEVIQTAGICWVKLEPRSKEQCQWLASCQSKEDFQQIKSKWPVKVTRGFFSANRTDRPLKRLVNRSLAPHREQAIGQVIEAKKSSHLLIELSQSVKLPLNLLLINPEGREVKFQLNQLKTLQGATMDGMANPGLYIIDWIKGGLARSLLLHHL